MLRASVNSTSKITYTYNGSILGSNSATTTLTISGVSFGNTGTNRVVAIVLTSGSNSSISISSATIGGVSATIATQTTASFRNNAIIYATIPSGTSGDVVITFNASSTTSTFAHSYSIYNATNTTPQDAKQSINTSTGVSATRSVSLTYSNNSVVIGGYSAGAYDPAAALTWTNVTIDIEDEGGSAVNSSSSSFKTTGATTTFQVTSTDTSVNRPGLVMASWR